MLTIDMDADQLLASLRRARGHITTVKRESLERTGRRIRDDQRSRLKAAGRVSSGRLQRAIDYRVTERGLVAYLEVGPRVGDPGVEPYDIVIDRGRRPGAAMPPPGALDDWMQRHGIPEEADFPIRKAIAERGIEAADYVGPGLRHVIRLMGETSLHVARVLRDA